MGMIANEILVVRGAGYASFSSRCVSIPAKNYHPILAAILIVKVQLFSDLHI